MLAKSLISVAIGAALALSPLRDSKLVKFLLIITVAYYIVFNYSRC